MACFHHGTIPSPDSLRYLVQKVAAVQTTTFGKNDKYSPSLASVAMLADGASVDGSSSGGGGRGRRARVSSGAASAAELTGLAEPLLASELGNLAASLDDATAMSREALQGARWRTLTTEVWWCNLQFILVRFAEDFCALHNNVSTLTGEVHACKK